MENTFFRDIPSSLEEDDLSERVEKWERHGFLNYFGSQRFGSCGVNTAEIVEETMALPFLDSST